MSVVVIADAGRDGKLVIVTNDPAASVKAVKTAGDLLPGAAVRTMESCPHPDVCTCGKCKPVGR